MSSSVCPCKGCNGRFLGCHAVCEQYIAWKAKDIEHKREVKSKQLTCVVHRCDFLGTSPPPGTRIRKRKKRYGSKRGW